MGMRTFFQSIQSFLCTLQEGKEHFANMPTVNAFEHYGRLIADAIKKERILKICKNICQTMPNEQFLIFNNASILFTIYKNLVGGNFLLV
jgi:hypothetical protein